MSSKVIVTIFGASGDLAKRKLYPSLFRLYKSGNLSDHFAVIGIRSDLFSGFAIYATDYVN